MSKWPMVKLGEVIEIRDGTHDSPKYIDTGFPLVTSKNIVKGNLDLTTINFISKEDYEKINLRSKVDLGDIIMPMIGTIGNPHLVIEEPNYAIKNVALLKFCKTDVINTYIFHLLNSPVFLSFVNSISRGGTQKFVSLNDIRRMQIPLPPFPEQKRIVELLDRAQGLIDRRKEQLSLMDTLTKSVFYEMFGDPVKNEKGWETDIVNNVCLSICGGGTPSTHKTEYFMGTIPWVSPKDMKFKYISTSIDKITEEAILNSSTKLIEKGAVLMVIRSGILKRTLPVAINTVPVTLNQDMKAFIPELQKIDNVFLMYIFKSFEKVLLAKVRAVTADNIEFEQIKNLCIPIPPIKKQIIFKEQINIIEDAKQNMSASLVELEYSFNALMQNAFTE